MGLINDELRENSQVDKPETPDKPVNQPGEGEGLATSPGSFLSSPPDLSPLQVTDEFTATENTGLNTLTGQEDVPVEPQADTGSFLPDVIEPTDLGQPKPAEASFENINIFKDLDSPEFRDINLDVPNPVLPYSFQTIRQPTTADALINREYVQSQITQEQNRQALAKRNPNLTKKDEGFWGATKGFLGDVFLGTERGRELAKKGVVNPLEGSYGNLGAGTFGFINTVLDAPSRLLAGVVGDTVSFAKNVPGAKLENTFVSLIPGGAYAARALAPVAGKVRDLGGAVADFTGKVAGAVSENLLGKDTTQRIAQSSKDRQERLKKGNTYKGYWNDYWLDVVTRVPVYFDPKNAEQVIAKYGSITNAALFNPVNDINNPIDPKTGRVANQNNFTPVFGSPRRTQDQKWYQDPVGAGLQILWELGNPADNLLPPIVSFGSRTPKSSSVLKALPDGTIVNQAAKLTPAQLYKQATEEAEQVLNQALASAGKNEVAQEAAKEAYRKSVQAARIQFQEGIEKVPRAYQQIPDPWRTSKASPPVPENTSNLLPGTKQPPLLPPAKPAPLPPAVDEVVEKVGVTGLPGKQIDIPKATSEVVEAVAPSPVSLIKKNTELSQVKAGVEKLADEIANTFDDAVDFGRKQLDTAGFSIQKAEDVMKILNKGAVPYLVPNAYDVLPKGLAGLLRKGDIGNYIAKSEVLGRSIADDITAVVAENNKLIQVPAKPSAFKPAKSVSVNASYYHGTSVKGWTPNYNLSLFGSRGELGSGLYLTKKLDEAENYARASTGLNTNPEIAVREIEQAVYEVAVKFDKALDANLKLPASDQLWSKLQQDLPESVNKQLTKLLSKRKFLTFSGFMDKLENAIAKTSNPDENLLNTVSKTISDNIRKYGYDGVVDNKVGWVSAIDPSTVTTKSKSPLSAFPKPTIEAASARYNADSAAKKAYPRRLSSDANLRDSAYAVTKTVADDVDNKLTQVQADLTKSINSAVMNNPEGSVLDTVYNGIVKASKDEITINFRGYDVAVVKAESGNLTSLSSNKVREMLEGKELVQQRVDDFSRTLTNETKVEAVVVEYVKDGKYRVLGDAESLRTFLDEGFEDIPVVVKANKMDETLDDFADAGKNFDPPDGCLP